MGMELRSGGRWELYVSRSAVRAGAFCDELSRRVDLAHAPAETPDPVAISHGPLLVERPKSDVLQFSWSRRTKPREFILSLIVLLSFAAILLGIKPFGVGPKSWIVACALAAFFLCLTLASIVRTIGERLTVRISQTSIEFERRAALSKVKAFSLRRSQVAVVDFSLLLTRAATQITLLRPEEVESFVTIRQGTFSPSDTLGMMGFLRKLSKIDVSALPTRERLRLAEALRGAVLQAG